MTRRKMRLVVFAAACMVAGIFGAYANDTEPVIFTYTGQMIRSDHIHEFHGVGIGVDERAAITDALQKGLHEYRRLHGVIPWGGSAHLQELTYSSDDPLPLLDLVHRVEE